MSVQDYVPGQNNPGQERPKTEGLTKAELLTAIARRVSFPTEEEQRAVFSAIDDHYGEHPPAETEGDDPESTDDGDETVPAAPAKSAAAPRKSAASRK